MNRRDFLKRTMATASALSLTPAFVQLSSATEPTAGPKILRVVRRTIEVNGRAASVFGLHGSEGPGLAFRAGERFDVLLRNETAEPTIVHWHGLTPPWGMDGVAGAPQPLLEAGGERKFDFPVGDAGTFWMHAHTLQEQALLAAPLIVRRAEDEAGDEQEVVILLHDFSFASPEELLARLTAGSGHTGGETVVVWSGADHGHGSAPAPSIVQFEERMDVNDIDYDAYLANDRTLDDPAIVHVEAGGRVRLRVINGATATAFTMDLGELAGTLIAVDGREVEPIVGSRFPLSMGQRIDVRLELPRGARSFPILGLREGQTQRTGIVLRPPGATVPKLASVGTEAAPVVDLALEARLRALSPLPARGADKHFDMVLTGGMHGGYVWGIRTPVPIRVDRGDRVEVTMRNDTMMAHPMHLHGHHFRVVAIDGQRLAGAVRDTVHIPPARSVTIAVDADNPGQWAFHCHHLYHMAAGMMTAFAYSA